MKVKVYKSPFATPPEAEPSPYLADTYTTCPVCNRSFQIATLNQRYCSKECARRARRPKADIAVKPTFEPESSDGQESGRARHGDVVYKQASEKVRRAIKSGKLVRPPTCDCCGASRAVVAHHVSYSPGRELDVRWLCKPCHELTHHPHLREKYAATLLRVDVPELRSLRLAVEAAGTRWVEFILKGTTNITPVGEASGAWITDQGQTLTKYAPTTGIGNLATSNWRVLPCYRPVGVQADDYMDTWPGRYFAHQTLCLGDCVPRTCRVLNVTQGMVTFAALKGDQPRRALQVHSLHSVARTEFEATQVRSWISPKAVRPLARLGKRIQRLREEQGWSQTELARRAGLRQEQVTRLEGGKRAKPTAALLAALAKPLAVSLDDLLRAERPRPRTHSSHQ